MKILMTEKEIMDGLKKAKENNPNATVGNAVEQMFFINPFSKEKAHSNDSYFVYANYPTDEYEEQSLLKTICEIYSMMSLGKIHLTGEDDTYGITILEGMKMPGPGHCIPLPPATISHEKIWHLLSSHYVVV